MLMGLRRISNGRKNIGSCGDHSKE